VASAVFTGSGGGGQPQLISAVSVSATRPLRNTTCSPGFTWKVPSPNCSYTMSAAVLRANERTQVRPRLSERMAK
jgi:hypothetical protein